MGSDSRVDGSSRTATLVDDGTCDETTMVCGAKPKEPIATERPDPQVSHAGDDWRIPELPPEQPSQLATIAKNMAATAAKPHVPNDVELRATYEKMSDGDLEKEIQRLTVRLTQHGPSSETALDTARFHAAESVVKKRNDEATAKAEAEKVEGWRVPSLQRGISGAVHEDENFTVGGAHVKVTPGGVDTGGAVVHGHGTASFGPVDVTMSGDGLGAGYSAGVHNADGSMGVHGGGGATAVGAEATLSIEGHGSVTIGAGVGPSVELSVGLKKDGDTTDVCARAGVAGFVFGACVPWRI